ncbi:peptide deformylase [Alicyclobacillus ferrooxydans]|uniref:Peptide deformylase n=1 Tax=Alicyclobacillus ferrooxydans TaxID=471514 RepID=A0A0P9D030_9BACL|nr:peptide deformylase [Alicyclobacillus ferrooxydans]KPV45345.1 peptide deformylase [Alicyclobacillus ferrooxydans]
MSIRIIRKGKDPVLRQVAKPVPKVTKAIEKVLDDMAETMYEAEGIGLAAVQVGILKRLVVADVGDGLVELINPEIIESSGSQRAYEGCLSLPGIRGEVDRAMNIKVRAWNRQEEEIEFEATELFARCIQHEVDHLNGILFTDYLKPSDIVQEDELERE